MQFLVFMFSYTIYFSDFLQDVITINNEGEILLSDSIQSGVHSFTVIATTQNSRATATASVRALIVFVHFNLHRNCIRIYS